MRFRAAVAPFRPPANEAAVLFPELAKNGGRFALAPGLLRAPPRGRRPPPCLSAVAWARPPTSLPRSIAGPDRVLAENGWETPALLAEAAAARRALVDGRVGSEWWCAGANLPAGGPYAVVALAEPLAADLPTDDSVAAAMLEAALGDNPADRLVVLVPGAIGPRLKSSLAAAAACGALIIDRPIDPWSLLDRALRVYSAGGEIGFLALLAGVRVTAFAPSFYTGWGASDDAAGVPSRPSRRSVDEIFAGACLIATRCRDPFRNRRADFREIVSILADWRRIEEANRRIAVCVGMSFWKRRRIADFVRSSVGVPAFCRNLAGTLAAARRAGAPPRAIAGWASRLPDGIAEAAAKEGVPLIRVEDGFIRSVGLGSDFLPPASLVFDRRGMYYDPRRPSDLEILLGEAEFDADLIARAKRLTGLLVTRGITKYNLAGGAPHVDLPDGRRVILVPGQVEDDLSLQFGAGPVRSNLALLAAVRGAEPDAYILYKPHPDVLAGHRKGAVSTVEARRYADGVVNDGSVAQLLGRVDEVHTMTSLAGFEALLRDRRVVVYGRPFYAGWGLTDDRLPCGRRRRLSLFELVAGVLILYPRYLDPLTRLPCGPEMVIERLDHPELWRPGVLVRGRRLQGAIVRRLGALRAMVN